MEEEEIKDFSKEGMKRLIEKGLSIHETNKKALEELVEKFLPEIMKIGNGEIKEVEKQVNDKVKEMKLPGSEVKNPIVKNPGKTPNL